MDGFSDPGSSDAVLAARTRRRGRWLLVAVVCAALGSTAALRGSWRASTADGPIGGASAVSAGDTGFRVRRGDLEEAVVAIGTIEPLARVEVRAEVPGVVRRVLAGQGDRVSRGQELVELGGDRLADLTAERRAALARARAEAGVDVVSRAAVQVEEARRRAARIERLATDGLVTPVEREAARRELRLAAIALRDADAERAARGAAVALAEEELRRAENDLARAMIRSPIDGMVIARPVEVGTGVADLSSMGGTLVAVVADDRRLRLVAEVDEGDVARVAVGQDVAVSVDALPGEAFRGVVERIAPAGRAERKISRFDVEVGAPADERLRVGMSAEARIVVGRRRGVLLVPNAALRVADDGGAPEVRLVVPEGSGVRAIRVDALASDGFQTAIADGTAVAEGARLAPWVP